MSSDSQTGRKWSAKTITMKIYSAENEIFEARAQKLLSGLSGWRKSSLALPNHWDVGISGTRSQTNNIVFNMQRDFLEGDDPEGDDAVNI